MLRLQRGWLVRRDRLGRRRGGAGGNGVVVPLVVYQAPSLSRSLAMQALQEAGRANRIMCTVKGVNGVLAAVRADWGSRSWPRR